jgi:hypothetical protein
MNSLIELVTSAEDSREQRGGRGMKQTEQKMAEVSDDRAAGIHESLGINRAQQELGRMGSRYPSLLKLLAAEHMPEARRSPLNMRWRHPFPES